MKIITLGAGRVGSSVAESLASEANDITVVDTDPARLKHLQDRLDLRTVMGNAGHPGVLTKAGAEDADLLLAVTQSDEANMVACKLAATHFNIPTRIARIRAADYSRPEIVEHSAIDRAICPEQILTDNIVKLIELPEALQVLEFAGGRVSLVAVRAFHGGPLVGHELQELRRHMPHIDARVAAVFRQGQPIVPEGTTAEGRRLRLRSVFHERELRAGKRRPVLSDEGGSPADEGELLRLPERHRHAPVRQDRLVPPHSLGAPADEDEAEGHLWQHANPLGPRDAG